VGFETHVVQRMGALVPGTSLYFLECQPWLEVVLGRFLAGARKTSQGIEFLTTGAGVVPTQAQVQQELQILEATLHGLQGGLEELVRSAGPEIDSLAIMSSILGLPLTAPGPGVGSHWTEDGLFLTGWGLEAEGDKQQLLLGDLLSSESGKSTRQRFYSGIATAAGLETPEESADQVIRSRPKQAKLPLVELLGLANAEPRNPQTASPETQVRPLIRAVRALGLAVIGLGLVLGGALVERRGAPAREVVALPEIDATSGKWALALLPDKPPVEAWYLRPLATGEESGPWLAQRIEGVDVLPGLIDRPDAPPPEGLSDRLDGIPWLTVTRTFPSTDSAEPPSRQ
jgi:hypothetical protein